MRVRLWVLAALGAAAIAAAAWFIHSDPGVRRYEPLKLRRRPKPPAGAHIFACPTLHTFKIDLTPDALNALRRDARKYAPATVTLNGRTFTNVAIHLKGAAGSYRGIDDQPALTLSFSKFVNGRRWDGLRKIHLNNSVQDPSFMNEYLASELFRAANVPTPRVAFATVEINARKLGLYVLKEGFAEEFLETFFHQDGGNLYDGGFVTDVDQDLELDEAGGVKDRSDLKALVAAAQEPDPTKRWQRLNTVLDVDRFVSYLALEVMLGDWDGYPMNRNNYRVYFNPTDRKAVFIPHGMDQLFQRTDMEIRPWFNGLVAQRLLETDAGGRLYDERFRDLFHRVFQLEDMTNAVAAVARVLRPAQPDINRRADDLRWAIGRRVKYLQQQPELKPPPPPPKPAPVEPPPSPPPQPKKAAPRAAPAPKTAAIPLPAWQPAPSGDARTEDTREPDGTRVLQIIANQASTASWRTKVKLKAGLYRFEGRARASGIQARRDDKGEGAGLRISNGPARTNRLAGDAGWTRLTYDFNVTDPETEVTLVCELRATRGRVAFDLQSLCVSPRDK